MARFVLPRNIYYGKGSLSCIALLKGKRAMLVTGGGAMEKMGFVKKSVELLHRGGMECRSFPCGDAEASLEIVSAGAKALREYKPDWILALGAGQCIDAAKLMWIYYEHPAARFSELLKREDGDFPALRRLARFAAIPSTSGTGGEVSAYAMVAGHKGGAAHVIWDPQLVPDLAILDPALTAAMPPRIAAYMGFHALTRALEAYAVFPEDPFTDPLALQALEMIVSALPASVQGEEKARETMHYAQCLAGMAASNRGIGPVQLLSEELSAAFNGFRLLSGAVNAVLLPAVLKSGIPAITARTARLSQRMQLGGESRNTQISRLIRLLETLRQEIGMAGSLSELGIPEAEFQMKKAELARKTAELPLLRALKLTLGKEELAAILELAFRGTETKKK